MKHVNIIYLDRAGLSRDMHIVAALLRDVGFQVTLTPANYFWPIHRLQAFRVFLRYRLPVLNAIFPCQKVSDINLFLQHIVPELLPQARVNCLIPNQEWFRNHHRPFLRAFDLILCKTRHAEAFFSGLGCRSEFISFTSFDRFDSDCVRKPHSFLHLAGQSPLKGTSAVVNLWLKHPEWPRLTIIQHPDHAQLIEAENIHYIVAYLDDTTLRRYQNESGIHLCPSEAEGFGHNIVEAMSCGAVTITTDAPPMNELITPARGLLAGFRTSQPHHSGTRYFVDPDSLAEQVERALCMSDTTRQGLEQRARDWYVQNDQFFRSRLLEVVTNL
jgi:glycosyltransferase involved in cell wall biosynthesis